MLPENCVPKSISVAETLREAAWVKAVSSTSWEPMSHWALTMPSLALLLEAVRPRVMWQLPPGARSFCVPLRAQSLVDSATA